MRCEFKRELPFKAVPLLLAVCALSIGAVLAYLTATDAKTNRFTLAGELDVEVTEAAWDSLPDSDGDGVPDAAENMLPAQRVAKDPAVTNNTGIDAFVFLEVEVPIRTIATAQADGSLNAAAATRLFSFDVNPGWSLVCDEESESAARTVYAYERALGRGTSPTLFDEVRLANFTNGQIPSNDLAQQVVVTAHAIQREGFDSPEEAWSALSGSSGENGPSQTGPAKSSFAIYSADDESLTLFNRPYDAEGSRKAVSDDMVLFSTTSLSESASELPAIGSVYEGRSVDAVYADVESTLYSYDVQPGWQSGINVSKIRSVKAADPISPISTSYWCAGMSSLSEVDFDMVDTSRTMSMEGMFAEAGDVSVDCSMWDASSVTSAENFNYAARNVRLPLNAVVSYAVWTDVGNNLHLCKGQAGSIPKAGDLWRETERVSQVYVGVERYYPYLTNTLSDDDSPFSAAGDGVLVNLKHVAVDTPLAPISTENWFARCPNISSFSGLDRLDMSECRSTRAMFKHCISLNDIDASSWDVSNVEDMTEMFADCWSLAGIGNVSGWNTGKVRSMERMFSNCPNRVTYSLAGWDTSSLESTAGMFQCGDIGATERHRIEVVDLSGWDMSSVRDMSDMFYRCERLREVRGIAGWHTSCVEDMSGMFGSATSLESLDISRWDVSSVARFSGMFNNCTHLASIGDVSGWSVGAAADMSRMFRCCGLLAARCGTWPVRADAAHAEFSDGAPGVDNPWRASVSFMGQSGRIARFDGTSGDDWTAMAVPSALSVSVAEGTAVVRACDTEEASFLGWYDDEGCTEGHEVAGIPCKMGVGDVVYYSKWGFSASSFAVYSEDDASLSLYKRPDAPRPGDVFDGRTATAVYQGFETATSRYSGWNGVKASVQRVEVCDGGIAPLSTAYWFADMAALQEAAGLGLLDTSRTANMSYMFSGCSSLISVDVSDWDASSLSDTSYMFKGCKKLNYIYATPGKPWTGVASSASMFSGCSRLFGSGGTCYNSQFLTASRAIVDGDGGQAGYFTDVVYRGVPTSYAVYSKDAAELRIYNRMEVPNVSSTFDGRKVTSIIRFLDRSSFSSGADSLYTSCGRGFTKVTVVDPISPVSTAYWFSGGNTIVEMDLALLDTSQVERMDYMFSGCTKISLDCSSWDVGRVESHEGFCHANVTPPAWKD